MSNKDFRCNIIWRSTDGLLPLPGIFITDFDVHASIEEEVSQFEVAVGMHIVACAEELNHEDSLSL